MDGNNPPDDGWNGGGMWGRVPQYIPPGPHNLPRGNPQRFGLGSIPGSGPVGIDVREVNRYPFCTTIALALGTADTIVVQQPETTRILLIIRCDASSAGSLLVAFGTSATINTAAFTIVAGGVVLLDYVIPQDDVHIAGTAAGCVGTAVYANSNL